MKKYIISAFALFTLFTTSGCQDWLDVNHDPNVLEEIPDGKVLLPAAEVNLGNSLMGWDFGFAGGFWSEYWTQKYTASQFKSICEYTETSFSTAYSNLTAGVLKDLKEIKTVAEESGNTGNYFVAEALSIYTWQILTDVWGSIPYSEALQGAEGIVSPKFDAGEEIYADLMARVDALLQTDLDGAQIDGEYDFIYGGDLGKWQLFANSLKLKLMMRLSETSGYNNATVVSFVDNNAFLTQSACIPGSYWSDGQEGKRHPMREFEAGGAGYLTTNVIACKNFLDYLANNNDPRLDRLFKIADTKTGWRGAFFGDFDSKEASDGSTSDDQVKYCTIRFTGDMDLMIMSNWEVCFFMAEAYARAGRHADAKAAYEQGVKASLSQHGISDHSILDDGYAAWKDGTVEEEIKQIAMQKWVANANYQHIESFLERNRVKYPAIYDVDIKMDRPGAYADLKIVGNLTVSVKGRARLNNSLPASPIYPTTILTTNENSPEQKQNIGEKVWWNQKKEVIIK